MVATLIEKNGKYLITRRSTGTHDALGKWEFHGGKVESGESEKETIEREAKEEFEMNIQTTKFLTNCVDEYPTKIIDLRLYECKYIPGEFSLYDSHKYQFVEKDNITKFDLCSYNG